jgi:hypothetical protein
VNVEFTPTTIVREHRMARGPATVVDFDRMRRPFNSVHGSQPRRPLATGAS